MRNWITLCESLSRDDPAYDPIHDPQHWRDNADEWHKHGKALRDLGYEDDELAAPGGTTAKQCDQHAGECEHGLARATESAPPGKKAERFIKKHKREFKQRYGKDGNSYLYGTAWKKFGHRESISLQHYLRLVENGH